MTINALTDPTGENNGATGVIGNYTQAAWAETTDVGCGYLSIEKRGYRKGRFLKSVSTIYTKVAIDIDNKLLLN